MRVDPAGLGAAAARLSEALGAVGGQHAVHPPLGADPASAGAAARLSTAAGELSASLQTQVAGLLATAEHLGLVAAGYTAVDEANAAGIAAVRGQQASAAVGQAPAAAPVPADVRSPLAPIPAAPGEALSAATHSGDSGAGQGFTATWSQVASAAGDAAAVIRSVADNLAQVLDSPSAAPAARTHLLSYAASFDQVGSRAQVLSQQAAEHAQQRDQAVRDIPSPQQFAAATERINQLQAANARARGMYAAPLAHAVADRVSLENQATAAYSSYHAATDVTTAATGDAPPDASTGGRSGAEDAEPGAVDPVTGEPLDPAVGLLSADGSDPASGPASPEGVGELAGMLPTMIPAVLGAAGGLLGGLMSAVTKAPEAAIQAGTQALSAATQGLSGLAEPDLGAVGLDGVGLGGSGGDLGGLVGGGDAGGGIGGETTPAAGGPIDPPAGVSPSTGLAPATPTVPAGAGGALPPPVQPAAPGGAMPLGMPMGAMQPGAAGGGAANRDAQGRQRKVIVPEVPHTEAVTGKSSAQRIAVSSTALAPDTADGQAREPDARPVGRPVVRRITTPPPKGDDE